MNPFSSPPPTRWKRALGAVARLAAQLPVLSLALLLAGPAAADSFTVDIGTTDVGDSNPGNGVCDDGTGKCSLRAAIQEGNARNGAHTITLSPSVAVIQVINGALPTMMAPFTVIGNSATTINGNGHGCLSLADSGTVGLGHGTGATGSSLTNLVIGNCGGDGISANGHNYTFMGNHIGVDATGLVAMPNTGHGISVSASQVYPDTSTGFLSSLYSTFPVQPVDASQINAFQSNLATALASLSPIMITGNVISGNDLNGIEIFSQNLAAVIASGNMIGTDVTGNVAIPNGGAGVHMVGSTFGNLIGPDNVISGNTGDGIKIDAGAVFLPNFIMGNRIGLPLTNLGQHIGNGLNGIATDTKPETDPLKFNPSLTALIIGPGNLISDNQGVNNNAFPDTLGSDSAGILITGASKAVKVIGNTIGIAEFPLGTPLASKTYGNAGEGIIITSSGNTIGGSSAGSGNNIAGNARHGIVVKGSSTTSNSILGNSIGVHAGLAGDLSIGNGVDGIHINAASSTSIGGAGTDDFNVIAGNGRNGVKLRNGGTGNGWSNLFQRNKVYGNAKMVTGVGIDLDHTENAIDGTHSEFPVNYANLDQSAPVICSGPADSGACSGSAAPATNGLNTTLDWTLATHGPADFRVEFFRINNANDNSATSMTFLGEQLVTTDINGVIANSGACSGGRCSAVIGGGTGNGYVVMTATDTTPLTDQPGGGSDWKSNLTCFIGNLGVILSSCNVNNTSELSNALTIPASSNAALSAMSVSAGSLIPAFASGTLSYADSVANAVSTITVTPTVADPNATVTVDSVGVTSGNASGAINLAVGPNTITVVVTAQDGTTTQTYTITVNRAGALSNDASLSALTISSGSLVPVFASNTLTYNDAVANPVTTVTVTPTVAQANATVTVNGIAVVSGNASGAINLNVGANPVSVVVTAEDGVATQTYTIAVNRAGALNNDASLSALTVSSGSLVPAFVSGTLSYADAVANAVNAITVTPTVTDNNATVTVNGIAVASGNASGAINLNVGSNPISVVVTAQDGSTTQTYTINVNRAGALSNNASLNALGISSGSLVPVFASGTLSYTDAVANGVSSITVTPTVAQANATVTVNGIAVTSGNASGAINLVVGVNPISVVVTAQDGITTQTYTITVNRAGALSNNANLNALAISSGSLVPAFASGTLSYTDAVANAVSSVTVTPTVAQANATVTVNGIAVASGNASGAINLVVGANPISVVVTAQDGTTTQTYTVTVNRAGALSNNASLNALSISSGSLVPAFASGTLLYTDAVANAVNSVTVTPTVAQANATVTVNGIAVTSGNASGAINLVVGANPISVVVTAQDGTTTQTYTITVNRAGALSNNASLNALTISSGSLLPAFASGTLSYTDAVVNAVSSVTVTPTVADVNATVTVNGIAVTSGNASGAINLVVGANPISVMVTAQDGTSTQTYTITVNRAGALSNNASLNALTISSGSLVPAFASGTLSYTDAVANAVSSVTVTPTVAQANATVTVNGVAVTSGNASGPINLAVGANPVTVVVTAQDGTTTQTYTVSVTRAAPPVTVYSAPTFTGTGTATAVLSGGGPGCTFGTTAFVGPPVPAPAGVTFPDGLFDFTTTGCTGTITVTVTFPTAFPAGTQYWKYGPTPGPVAAHWYALGAANSLTLAGNTATFTITDGGLGDDDLAVNGTIVDQGGPGISAAQAGGVAAIPTLGEWGMLMLCSLMLLTGFAMTRRTILRAGPQA